MNSDLNDGGPAFPLPSEHAAEGMTLRDYLAAKAMQGGMTRFEGMAHNLRPEYLEELARHWYRVADTMLKVRNA